MRWVWKSSTYRRLVAATSIVAALFVAATGTAASAQNATAIAQGFETSDASVTVGALVSIQQNKQSAVKLASVGDTVGLAGIVADKPLVELTSSSKTVQVVTSGLTKAFVSDINGEVRVGDKVTISPIDGVGMKATSSAQIVGVAQADLNKADGLTQKYITDKNGKQQSVRIGLIPVQVNISYYVAPNESHNFIPPVLQGFANSIAGRDVTPARIIAAALVLLLGFVSIAVLLYASVNSSIISIGRNPLSEGAVHKSLLEVGAIGIGVLLVMLIAIYLILTV